MSLAKGWLPVPSQLPTELCLIMTGVGILIGFLLGVVLT